MIKYTDKGDFILDNTYNLDYNSSKVQPMSQKRASAYRLWETVNKYLGGNTIFFHFSEQSKYTYDDFSEYIGCDATEYFFDEKSKARVFTWIAEDNSTAKFSVFLTYKADCDNWTLNYSGSANLITQPKK